MIQYRDLGVLMCHYKASMHSDGLILVLKTHWIHHLLSTLFNNLSHILQKKMTLYSYKVDIPTLSDA